ncbi:DUF3267 domain-containing protein [Persicitalea jodogahamensis]|uniref:DUF3267 domain-containing protein n=1 Tax=Persicitalea jodogahamensis TaxID=402147 RepID=A0A8J3G7B1_9BACT|nr:DUF3267 domain-containing protein [Persicitalea jodogahamensis]GHB54324.1 hypothetical protein GCM10007390_04120 [Persicitalea jodogahamensis]
MTRPTVDTLHRSDEYQLVESFTIDEMTVFLAREAGLQATSGGKPNQKTAGFWFLMIGLGCFGGAIGWLIGSAVRNSVNNQLMAPGWQLGLGVLAFFVLLLPLHELIHAAFFKLLGASKIGFGYSVKGLMVYAYAQQFVMELRENAIVAAMPFLIITSLLAGLLAFVPQLQYLWLLLLIFHTLGCIGDFILVKHAWTNRHRNMVTYDDLEEKRTYFFVKK